jgi:hypothetical protein
MHWVLRIRISVLYVCMIVLVFGVLYLYMHIEKKSEIVCVGSAFPPQKYNGNHPTYVVSTPTTQTKSMTPTYQASVIALHDLGITGNVVWRYGIKLFQEMIDRCCDIKGYFGIGQPTIQFVTFSLWQH